MSANTRSFETRPARAYSETRARLAILSVTAVELIHSGARSPNMIEELLFSLQLFKEDRLSSVHPIAPVGKVERDSLRRGLKEQIAQEGEDVVYQAFLNELPLRIQTILCGLGIRTFHELLRSNRFKITSARGSGRKCAEMLEEVMARYGLSFTLNEEQIAGLFS